MQKFDYARGIPVNKQLTWLKIKPLINGFGRIINYLNFDDHTDRPIRSNQNVMRKVIEGKLVKGELTGYGRIMSSYTVQVGFFKEGVLYGLGIEYTSYDDMGVWNNGYKLGPYDIKSFKENVNVVKFKE